MHVLRALCSSAGRDVALALSLFAAGCCSPAPDARGFFDRLEPFDTASAFAYALETEQWEFALRDCLSEESRARLTPLELRAAVESPFPLRSGGRDAGTASLRDLIVEARLLRPPIDARAVTFLDRRPALLLAAPLHLARESEASAKAAGREDRMWLVDLDRTLLDLREGRFRLLNREEALRDADTRIRAAAGDLPAE